MRHSPEIIARARQMYADSEATVADICRDCEISQYALYYWVDGGPPTGELHLEPLPRRGDKVARGGRLRRLRGGRVRELYCLRPDRMRVLPGPDGWAEAYSASPLSRGVPADPETRVKSGG